MVRRASFAVIAGLTLSSAAGCHLGPQPRATKPEAPLIRRDPAAERFIEQHNRNAAAITSLRAEPSVAVSGGITAHANGFLALEGNRNFCLDLRHTVKGEVANIGSNPDEFWFWVDDDKDKAVNFCRYSDVARSPLVLSYQPDWIMEAMGLRPITAAEARTLSVKAGDQPNTMVLTQTRKDPQGQTYTKETVVDEATGRILEHHLWLGVKQKEIARAKITTYNRTEITDPAIGPDGIPPMKQFVYLPEKFRLEWIQEKLVLDINLYPSKRSRFQVNPQFDEKQRADMFSEPSIDGTVRRDLARFDADPAAVPTRPPANTQVRETRPIPNRGITLGSPIPDGVEAGVGPGASTDGAVRTSIEPDLPPLDPAASSPNPTGWTTRKRGLFGTR